MKKNTYSFTFQMDEQKKTMKCKKVDVLFKYKPSTSGVS